MKNKAYTLAEILITLTIVGMLAVIMFKNLRTDDHMEKTFVPKALKAIEVFGEASTQILDVDNANCPMSEFIINNNTIGLYNSSGKAVSSQEAFNMFAKFIKFEKSGINFCDNSGYCESSTSIPAGRISADTYVGLAVTSVTDCPDYYKPGVDTKVSVTTDLLTGAKTKCWAKLYIDVNGAEGPNTEGKDVFVLGMDRRGVHY